MFENFIALLAHFGFVIAAAVALIASYFAHIKWKREQAAAMDLYVETERHANLQN